LKLGKILSGDRMGGGFLFSEKTFILWGKGRVGKLVLVIQFVS
jgi:hypothetical protein